MGNIQNRVDALFIREQVGCGRPTELSPDRARIRVASELRGRNRRFR